MIEPSDSVCARDLTRPAIGLLQETRPIVPDEARETTSGKVATRRSRIRCPECSWEPRKSDTWWCDDCDWPEFFKGGCGTTWHTFDTGGVCPGCGHRWQWTSCLRCHNWSLHDDWYEQEADE